MTEQTLEVPEVTCGHCVSAIEGAVGALDGVSSVKVSLENKDVTVDYDDSALQMASIVSAIEGEGYKVGTAPAVHQIGDKPNA